MIESLQLHALHGAVSSSRDARQRGDPPNQADGRRRSIPMCLAPGAIPPSLLRRADHAIQ